MFFNKINAKVAVFITFSAILLCSIAATAQDTDTTKAASLFGGELSHNGGYGAPELKFYPGAGVGGLF